MYRQLSAKYAPVETDSAAQRQEAAKSQGEADMKTAQLEAAILSNQRSLVILQSLDTSDSALYEVMEE